MDIPVDSAALTQRIEEIDDALTTRAPIALDMALLLVERKSAYETLYPDAGRGGDRKSAAFRDGIKAKSTSFCSATAERLGVSPRWVQVQVATGEAVAPYAQTLRTTSISDNAAALKAFAELEPVARGAVLATLCGDDRISWSAALVAARLRVAEDAEEAQFRALTQLWSRASSRARRRFLVEIGLDSAAVEQLVRAWQKRSPASGAARPLLPDGETEGGGS